MSMLIAGRAVQGIGGGGVTMLVDIVVCDLVPLRERGSVMGIIFVGVAVGTALGPFIGGILVEATTWRWVFFLSIPVCATAIGLLWIFLHLKYERESTWIAKFKRVDVVGNAIFVASTASILIALTDAGTQYQWSSWHILVPLILGFMGLIVFYFFEVSTLCLEPSLPGRLFANRTSVVAFGLTFIHTLLLYWEIYFMPVYFQAVQGSTPARSGVQLLPTVITLMVFGAIGGGVMEKTGRYRPFHHAGFALMTIGFGLFTLLNNHSSTAVWVVFQIIFAAGSGLSIGTLLAAAQAELPEGDAATATGTWAVIRSFGSIWGITISSTIFNNKFSDLSNRITDARVQALLSDGQAYQHGTKEFLGSLASQPRTFSQVVSVYTDSLKLGWQVAIGLSALGLLLVGFEKEVNLRTELETEFGLEKKNNVEGKVEPPSE